MLCLLRTFVCVLNAVENNNITMRVSSLSSLPVGVASFENLTLRVRLLRVVIVLFTMMVMAMCL